MITVYVDGHAVKVPPSATVGHAILRYDPKVFEMLQDGVCTVSDEAGRDVDPGGAVFGGMQLFVTEAA